MTSAAIVLLLVVVVAIGSVLLCVRRVPAGQVGVVERLGRFERMVPAGLLLALPGDKIRRVSLAEQRAVVAAQTVTTSDEQPVSVAASVSFTVSDARLATYEIANPLVAVEQIVLTAIRAKASTMDVETLLTSTGAVTEQVRQVLAGTLPGWGLTPGRVDVRLERGGWDQPGQPGQPR